MKKLAHKLGRPSFYSRDNKFSLPTKQRKDPENSWMDQRTPVKGVENPADIGTRGMPTEGLVESGWLNGPAWLLTDEKLAKAVVPSQRS